MALKRLRRLCRRSIPTREKARLRKRAMPSPSISKARSAEKRLRAGKAENFDLTLGSGAFVPGFEDQLDRREGRR